MAAHPESAPYPAGAKLIAAYQALLILA